MVTCWSPSPRRRAGPLAALPSYGLPVESWRATGSQRWRGQQQQWKRQQQQWRRRRSKWSWCYRGDKRRWRRSNGPDLLGTAAEPYPEEASTNGTHPHGSAVAQGGAAVAARYCLHPTPQGYPGEGRGPGWGPGRGLLLGRPRSSTGCQAQHFPGVPAGLQRTPETEQQPLCQVLHSGITLGSTPDKRQTTGRDGQFTTTEIVVYRDVTDMRLKWMLFFESVFLSFTLLFLSSLALLCCFHTFHSLTPSLLFWWIFSHSFYFLLEYSFILKWKHMRIAKMIYWKFEKEKKILLNLY